MPGEAGAVTLLAGDIGATTTRLALITSEAGPRKFLAEQEFHSAKYPGLAPIVAAFLATHGGKPVANMLGDVPVHIITVNAALMGAAIYGLEHSEQH